MFVDTAGIRRPGRRDRLAERGSALMAVRAIERADVVLVLIDASEGFTDQDMHLLGLVRERGRGLRAAREQVGPGRRAGARALGDEIARRLRGMPDVPVLAASRRARGRACERVLARVRRLARAAAPRDPDGRAQPLAPGGRAAARARDGAARRRASAR